MVHRWGADALSQSPKTAAVEITDAGGRYNRCYERTAATAFGVSDRGAELDDSTSCISEDKCSEVGLLHTAKQLQIFKLGTCEGPTSLTGQLRRSFRDAVSLSETSTIPQLVHRLSAKG